MTYRVLPLLLLLISFSLFTNGQTLLTDTTAFRFLNVDMEPESSWKEKDFDDSSWQLSTGYNFAVNDSKINNLSPEVKTLYARSYFNIANPQDYKKIVLFIDYDDGFVAYVNGVELARVSMGKKGSIVKHNQLAERSHEMREFVLSSQDVIGYYLDSTFIKEHLVEGRNTVSVQVHNDRIDGNDLGVFINALDVTGQEYNPTRESTRYKRCVQLDSTHLPIVVIETDELGVVYKQIKTTATLGIINNGDGKYNFPENEFNDYYGTISIEMRGQSSSHYPKQSYNIELKSTSEEDTNAMLIGMPTEGDWILQGPFADKSQIRNALIYDLARKTGRYAPRIQFCEVIMNGEFIGLYNLVEKIKRDDDRVDINRMHTDEISGQDVTGGYILKYDKPSSILEVVYPKEKNIQPEQKSYIMGHMQAYLDNLHSNIGLDSKLGYKKYIKPNSLLDYVIIAELGKNCDSYLYSTYLYKEKDKDDDLGQIVYGPLWDFDLCFGNSIWQEGHQTNGWQFEYPSNKRFEVTRLLQDKELAEKFAKRWFEYREEFLHKDSLFNQIDALTSYLADPIDRNYEVWPVEDEGLFFPAYIVPTYEDEILFIKDWITERLAWIDSNIGLIDYEITDYKTNITNNDYSPFNAQVYPNPIHNEFFVDLNMPQAGNLTIELINIQGQVTEVIEDTFIEQGDYKVYWNSGTSYIEPGLYIISLKVDGETYQHIKVLFE